ncbi:hypothetical protein GCM10027030_28530 [Luteococcus sediminum]
MSAVSKKVIPASSAAWMVARACSGLGCGSRAMLRGMQPIPMALTVNGPSCRVLMDSTLARGRNESVGILADQRKKDLG